MTGRTSLLRRLRVLEDLEAQRASPGTPDIVRAMELLEDGPLIRLEEALGAGRVGQGEMLGGPLALRCLALEEPQEEEAAVWARAYLSGEGGRLPDLPEDAPDTFADRAAWCEEEAAELEDGEEKTRTQDAAAVWAMLEALARVLLERVGTAKKGTGGPRLSVVSLSARASVMGSIRQQRGKP